MSGTDDKDDRLPAPAGVILLYAADGLAVWCHRFSRVGRPRTPERSIWVPMFWVLARSPDGLQTLKALAEAGMRAWHCPPVYLDCLRAAFSEVSFPGRAIAALEDLADTARERIALPLPPVCVPPQETGPTPVTEKRPSRSRPWPNLWPGPKGGPC